jgi:hypothetical protein
MVSQDAVGNNREVFGVPLFSKPRRVKTGSPDLPAPRPVAGTM